MTTAALVVIDLGRHMRAMSMPHSAASIVISSQQAVDDAFDSLVRRYHSSENPAIIVAVAATTALGLDLIAYLTDQKTRAR